MAKKKKNVALVTQQSNLDNEVKTPAPQQPLSLADQAKDLHTEIAKCEDSAAPLYFRLGAVLKNIKEEKLRLEGLACLCHRIARAAAESGRACPPHPQVVRVHAREGQWADRLRSLATQAQGHQARYSTATRAPLTRSEFSAANRLITLVGDKERAREVLQLVLEGKEPVKRVKEKVEKTWLPAWEEIRDNRDELRKRIGGNRELHDHGSRCPTSPERFQPTKRSRQTRIARLTGSAKSAPGATASWRRRT